MKKEYSIKIDTHCHSIASHHAMCTVMETISIAKEKGLEGVTISDHHPSLRGRYKNNLIQAPDIAFFSVFCQRYVNTEKDIRLYKGIELNLLQKEPWVSAISTRLSDNLDLKIAGIHPFDHLFKKIEDITGNTDAVLEAVHLGEKRPFHILAHPITPGVPLDMDNIIKACRERKIAIELNNSFVLYEKVQVGLIEEMLEKTAFHGCYLSVGSDAHTPHEIGLFNSAIELLEKVDFPPELIVNRNMEILDEFLRE